MRIGELLAIISTNYHKSFVRVMSQLTEDGTYRKPKNRKERNAAIIPEGRVWVEKWCAVPRSEKEKLLHWDHRRPLKRACIKVFPGQDHKHCTIHNLRHSYAIYWRNKGASFSQIAGLLGNTESVCRDHYTGHGLTDEGVESVLRLVSKG
jgi:integrase